MNVIVLLFSSFCVIFLDEKAVKNPTHPLLKVFVNPFTMVPQSQLIICYIGM